jgi:hypothetical protein
MPRRQPAEATENPTPIRAVPAVPPKRKKQVFELDGDVRVTIDFPAGQARWASTHNTVSIATGDAALPPTVDARRENGPRSSTYQGRPDIPGGSESDYLRPLSAAGYTGDGPPPPGLDPISAIASTIEDNILATELAGGPVD